MIWVYLVGISIGILIGYIIFKLIQEIKNG